MQARLCPNEALALTLLLALWESDSELLIFPATSRTVLVV